MSAIAPPWVADCWTIEVEPDVLPFIDTVGDHLTIAARCGDCGWIGERLLYTSTARWQVAIACSLHVCVSPIVGLEPTVA